MGNSSSSGRGHHEDTVDFGHIAPQGVYTGPRDWNQDIVVQLISGRKLAPFYRPLEDYDDSWDDEQILAARKEPPDSDPNQQDAAVTRAESISSSSSKTHHKRSSISKEVARQPEAAIYRGAVECPICFLYYPPNINHSRCCDQAICTECFVQIKRADPTTTHLVSEPASCPYCVQESFGVVYTPPSWRAGIGSEGAAPPSWSDPPKGAPSHSNAAMKRRRRSFGPDSPEVVTIDQIRPDWEAKLAAVRAAVARRANRRIIMRQVGDRLIPVGVTSGRVHALPTGEEAQGDGEGGPDRGNRRNRRRNQNQDLNQFLGTMGLGGQDLEELMIMEAMRLSLIEHDEQQRREREAKSKDEGNNQGVDPTSGEGSSPSAAVPDSSSPTTQDAEVSAALLTSPVSEGTSRLSSDMTNRAPSDDNSRSSRGHTLSTALARSSGGTSRKSSVSPYRVSAALRSAASTAGAVLSGDTDDNSSSLRQNSEDAQPTLSITNNETTPLTNATPLPPESAHPITTPDTPSSSADTTGSTTSLPVRVHPNTDTSPLIQHSESFASSIDSRNIPTYDPLPSVPGSVASSYSHKPLLASPNLPDAPSGDGAGNSSQSAITASPTM